MLGEWRGAGKFCVAKAGGFSAQNLKIPHVEFAQNAG